MLILFLFGAISVIGGEPAFQIDTPVRTNVPPELSINEEKTKQYLQSLRIRNFEINGTTYTNENFSPTRLNVPLDEIDDHRDSDYQRTDTVRKALKGVSRKVVLQHIFAEVTKEAQTNTEKHIAILKFLHKSSFHSKYIQPMERTGRAVDDPLLLLHLGEMRCSHVSRVAVDLFETSGFRARVVQLGGHQIAEIFYDGGWHYFDGDVFGNGETVIDEKGNIPSVVELSKDPSALDSLGHYRELQYGAKLKVTSSFYPSYPYFGQDAYRPSSGNGLYYEKTASEEDERNHRFGWNFYKKLRDNNRVLYKMPPLYQPGGVIVTRIRVRIAQLKGIVSLNWNKARDRDNDVLGYKVFVSHQSRGWEFGGDRSLPRQGKEFVVRKGGWHPSMYEKMFEIPPHDVALLTTEKLSIEITLPVGEEYFFTVMPFDAHGEKVGKELYMLSHEFHVDFRKTVI